jgi:hypothetical protein
LKYKIDLHHHHHYHHHHHPPADLEPIKMLGVEYQTYISTTNLFITLIHSQTFAELTSRTSLLINMNPTHCSVCDKVFSSKYNLNRHTISCQRRVEKQVNPTICDVCGKILSNVGNLRRHMRLHTETSVNTGESLSKVNMVSTTPEVTDDPAVSDTPEVAEAPDTPEVAESSEVPENPEDPEDPEDQEQEFTCLVCKRKCTLENDCSCPTTVYISSNLVYNMYY